MLGVVCFWLGITLSHPLSQVIQEAKTGNEVNMSCDTVTSYQDKANCVAVDVMLPLLVGTLLGIAGFMIGGRLV
jgi:hypothetical protein